MPTNSIMIEVVTNEAIGLLAVQAAGEVIAADAAFNLRVSDAHGPSGDGTAPGMMEHIKAYEGEVETVQKAWAAFKDDIAKGAMLRVEPHDALEEALRALRRKLDEMK
jgi:hypothetical protein